MNIKLIIISLIVLFFLAHWLTIVRPSRDVQSGYRFGFFDFSVFRLENITIILNPYLLWFGSVYIPSVFGLFGFIPKQNYLVWDHII